VPPSLQLNGWSRVKSTKQIAVEEREEFLEHFHALIDPVLTLLGIVWLVLLVLDLSGSLSPELQLVTLILWLIFIADYLLELVIAPDRLAYLRANWVGAIALVIPAVRFFAAFRAFAALRSLRAVRTLNLARLLTSTNRGLRTVRAFFRTNQLGLVVASSAVVTLAGAAAIYFFEGSENGDIQNFGDALWWSGMMLTTMGSQFWPQTWEGRVVAWLLALYSFAVFGYITATLASYFVRSKESLTSRSC
jgi:voltage-gated potassium channel